MDDEFKLCWKNFQDNIASGFQNLYDRGDLVDVTLACDGKLLHAHKIVLAICSPYFQEIFTTNPCKHPIIILKDVHFNIMCELLEFMYQGVVNVKHTELQSFMKIGQLLHIKGLATNSSAASTLAEKAAADKKETPSEVVTNKCTDTKNSTNSANDTNRSERDSNSATKPSKAAEVPLVTSPASSPLPMIHPQQTKEHFALHDFHSSANLKRQAEINSDTSSFHTKKQFRRSGSHTDQMSDHTDENDRGLDHVSSEDFFLSTIPHISMVESRYDYNSVKREADHSDNSAALSSMRNSFPSSFGIDYNLYKNSSDTSVPSEFSNETLHLANDCLKNFGNHMDIPPSSSNVTMLSSTSLLHGNCVFNRNNTVATQQGMKTYWLCKSYRISMCRARCITHQGRVISATGVHNHPPHMRKGPVVPGGGGYLSDAAQIPQSLPPTSHASHISTSNMPSAAMPPGGGSMNNSAGCFSNLRLSQATVSNLFQQNQPLQHLQSISPPSTHSSYLHPHTLSHPHHNLMIQQNASVQNSNMANTSPQTSQSSLPPAPQTNNGFNPNAMPNVSNMLLHPAIGHTTTAPHHPLYVRDSSVQHQNLNSNLIITSVTSESLTSNSSKQSQHTSNLNEPVIDGQITKSPARISQSGKCSSSNHAPEQIALLHNNNNNNTALSPSETAAAETIERSARSPTNCDDIRCFGVQDQVNETVTICSDSEQSFKMEIAPGEHWFQGKLEFMLSQRGKPLLVHDGHTFGIQYVRKDKKYWQCNLSRKFNCKARVTTTDTGEIIVTNNEHCHTEIRQHLRKDYQRNKVMMNALINLSSNRFSENLRRQSVHSLSNSLNSIHNLSALVHNSVVDAPLSLQSTQMEDAQRSLEICGSESTSSVTNLETLKTSRPPEDNDLPLDCGMKTLTNEALSRQQ